MKIYGSTEYFDRDAQTETYYELSVISQWNWSAKTICRKPLSDGYMISYSLRQGNPHKIMTLEDITPEIREQLESRGYTMAGK